jgi:DNA-directed RNA polymerase specialized sigma24 family protein
MSISNIEWSELHRKHQAQAVRLAVGLLRNGLSREPFDAAQDIVQKAWITSFRIGKDATHARALLFRCVRIIALDAIRGDKRHEKLNEESIVGQRTEVELGWGATANPQLLLASQTLTSEAFDTWYLQDVVKLSHADVQSECQISAGAYYGRLSRARHLLAAQDG